MRRFLCTLLFICSWTFSATAQIVKADFDSNHKYGFKDAKDNWVIKPQYGFAYWYNDWNLGIFQMEEGGTAGLLNASGSIIFPIGKYKSYFYDEKYLRITNLEGKVGLAKLDGGIFVNCKYSSIYVYDNYIEVTNEKNLNGLLTADGKEWLPCEYKKIYVSSDYIEVTNERGLVGLLTMEGKDWIPCKYKTISIYEKENIIKTKGKDGKLGAYSMQGEIIAECKYDTLMSAADEIVLVNKGGKEIKYKWIGGKWGYCANGKEIIPCEYDQASVFKNDVATVKKDGEVKLIKNPLKDGSLIQIAENTSPSKSRKEKGAAISRYPAPNSDVDRNIPTAKKQADNTFAFIIANENYPDAPVPYSLNDGRMFREYCHKALGLPEKNINLYEDATFGSIITAVEKMKSIADAYDGEASVIFYYAGHGFPDEKQNTAYLLPIDGNASDITTTGYSLAKLYKELSQLKLKSSIVFLDACFSGAKREDQMLSQARGVAIKVKDETPQGNMVVFSAAQGDETAHQMEEKRHGLFTYYLLKQLQATGGDVDMGTLTEYVTRQVKRQSVVINNKKQTPTVIPSQALLNSWKAIKLK